MKTIKKCKVLLLSIIAITALSACSDDDDGNPEAVNEEEVITDVTISLTDENGNTEEYTYTDPQYRDDSYQAPVITMEPETVYDVKVDFYNASNPDDVETITEEIREEKNAHFLEYDFNDVDINLTRTDGQTSTDDNGVQIGLMTEWTATETGNGQVTVTLIHEPSTKDTSDPYGDHTGGETDVSVTFDVNVE